MGRSKAPATQHVSSTSPISPNTTHTHTNSSVYPPPPTTTDNPNNTTPSTIDHVVLIDFASTTQTFDPQNPNLTSNYFNLLRVLLSRKGDIHIDPDLVSDYFGEPDEWDCIFAIVPLVPLGKEVKNIEARSMFPFIL